MGGGGRTNCQIWLVSTLTCPEDEGGGGGGRTYQLSDLVSEYTKDLVSEYTKDLVSEYTNMPRGERGGWHSVHSVEAATQRGGVADHRVEGGGGGG